MNKITIILAIALSLNTITTSAQTERPKVVNGQPCVRELCIGDDLTTLNIDWHPANRARSYRNIVPKKTMLGDPQSIQEFAPYWNSRLIDKKGLIALSKIQGFCRPTPGELRGEYTDKAGRTVIVSFSLIAINNGKKQKFVVDWVRTILPDTENITVEQFQNIQAQVRTQYPGVDGFNLEGRPYVSVGGILHNGSFNKTVGLWGAPLTNFKDNDLFLRYPGCGGDRIIPTD